MISVFLALLVLFIISAMHLTWLRRVKVELDLLTIRFMGHKERLQQIHGDLLDIHSSPDVQKSGLLEEKVTESVKQGLYNFKSISHNEGKLMMHEQEISGLVRRVMQLEKINLKLSGLKKNKNEDLSKKPIKHTVEVDEDLDIDPIAMFNEVGKQIKAMKKGVEEKK